MERIEKVVKEMKAEGMNIKVRVTTIWVKAAIYVSHVLRSKWLVRKLLKCTVVKIYLDGVVVERIKFGDYIKINDE